jgi:hypothetical protein
MMYGDSGGSVKMVKSPIVIIAALSGLALASLAPGPSRATQLKLMAAEEMAARSERIVTGRVTGVESFWNEKRTKIFTRTTVTVDGTYKGAEGGSVDILQLGGVVDNVRVTVDGAIAWKMNEEVLLFLEPYVEGAYQVTGMSQGKFLVERDTETGERFVSRPAIAGVEMMTLDDGGGPVKDAGVQKVSLEKFVADALSGSE